MELTGNSIFEYIHQADHDEMISVLSPPLPQNLPAENMMMSKLLNTISYDALEMVDTNKKTNFRFDRV